MTNPTPAQMLTGTAGRKPKITPATLAESIRQQLRTWAVHQWGERVAESPDAIGDAGDLSAMVARIVRAAERNEEGDDDAAAWGLAHMIHADADAIRAAHGYGSGYLVGVLYSVIVASAYFEGGYSGDRVEFSPYPNDRVPAVTLPPVVTKEAGTTAVHPQPVVTSPLESALIETVRTLVHVYNPAGSGVYVPPRGSWLDAPRLSDLIGEVADSFERRFGDFDGDNEVRAVAHMINARAHALKAGYGHGPAYVLACLDALVLVVAAFGHL